MPHLTMTQGNPQTSFSPARHSRRHLAQELVVFTKGAEGSSVHHCGPLPPAVLADLVATTQRLWCPSASHVAEVLEADGALRLAAGGEELQLLLKAVKDAGHESVVPVGLPHHVEDEPLPLTVVDAHGLLRVDAPHLLVQ